MALLSPNIAPSIVAARMRKLTAALGEANQWRTFSDTGSIASTPLRGSRIIFEKNPEADFEKGYRINLDGTRMLLDAIRKANYKPRLVFSSSIGVFGAPFPERIGDEFFCTPLTSYGTQKAICELLISDYTRKGILDGVAIRLPTICVRPGKPNKAASASPETIAAR